VKIVHFYSNGTTRFGVKIESGVVDIRAALEAFPRQGVPASLEALWAGGRAAQDALEGYIKSVGVGASSSPWLRDEDKLDFAPCVPDPGKIICIGLNYRRHAAESGMATPATPVLFSKFPNALAAHKEAVPLYPNAEQYDYEAELVIVIGRRARFVSEADALNYVFGYCNGNDLSARDLQMRTTQWLLGKSPDKFMPIGPYLVSSDQAGDAGSLSIRCWLNGELRQNSNTNDMVFTVEQLVSYISQYMTLEPGDLISTGTPQGVILGMKEKNWMKPGDRVEIEVEGLGKLFNPMV